MTPVLAHQGGWDEMLVAAGLILAVMGLGRLLRRRGERQSVEEPRHHRVPETCAYCGAAMPPGAERCPSCGFRATTSG